MRRVGLVLLASFAACADMAKITPEKLACCLMELTEDYRVRVPENVIADARLALERMLRI